jgi:hypothetical protein
MNVLGGDKAYNSPQALVQLAGDLTTWRTPHQMTPAHRAAAETRQHIWARKVRSLRGEDYDPEAADQADCETPDPIDDSVDLTEAQLTRQTAERALTMEK